MNVLFQRAWRSGQPTIFSRGKEIALAQTGPFSVLDLTVRLQGFYPREPRNYLTRRAHGVLIVLVRQGKLRKIRDGDARMVPSLWEVTR